MDRRMAFDRARPSSTRASTTGYPWYSYAQLLPLCVDCRFAHVSGKEVLCRQPGEDAKLYEKVQGVDELLVERLHIYRIGLLFPRAVLELIHRLGEPFGHIPGTAPKDGLTLVRRDVHGNPRVREQPVLCFDLMKPFEQLALPCENQIKLIHESSPLVLDRFVESRLRRP